MNKPVIGEKLTVREKVSFSLINIGNIPVMTLIGSFLLIFYTDVVGLNPAAVATLFLITRIFDGINDPIMGYLIDHLPQTRMGRFRPYLMIGTVFCSLNFLLLWFGPVLFTGAKLFIAYISYILIGVTFDLMDIPLNSLLPVITDNDSQRNTLSIIKGLSYQLGFTVITFIAPLILANASTQLRGYGVLVVGAVIIIITLSMTGVLGIKERVKPAGHKPRYQVRDALKIISIRPLMVYFIAKFITNVGRAVGGALHVYYFTYILNHNLQAMSINSLFLLAGSIPGMMMLKLFCRKFEKKHVFIMTMLLGAAGTLLRFVNLTSPAVIYISAVITSFAQGISLTLSYSILADNVDFVYHKLGIRAEATINSIQSFIAKAGSAIGGAIPGYVLALTGYIPLETQNHATLVGIIVMSLAVPVVFSLISAIVFGLGYKQKRSEAV